MYHLLARARAHSHDAHRRLLVALAVPLLFASLTACGGDADEDAPPTYATLPAAPVSALIDATEEPDGALDGDVESRDDGDDTASDGDDAGDEGASEGDDAVASFGPARLPADGEAAIVQLARIEPSPWEPAIAAQMVPHFSLLANGRGYFAAPGGESEDGWYQTAITPADAEGFLQRFVDEIGVLEMAAAQGEPETHFETPSDGQAPRCEDSDQVAAVGVIYVKSDQREGRFVFSQCDLISPSGPNAQQLLELQQVLTLVQFWKQGVFAEFSSEEITATRSLLGWWSDLQQPYTPDSAVGFGTRARGQIPDDAPIASWPLDVPLSEAFDADYGAAPVEVLFSAPDHVALLRTARTSLGSPWGPRFWGPLWQDGRGDPYFVGIRPSVPGGNHVVLDYTYQMPRRGIGAGQ